MYKTLELICAPQLYLLLVHMFQMAKQTQVKQLTGHQRRPALLYMLWVGLLIPNDEKLLVWITPQRCNYFHKEWVIPSLSFS